MGGGVQQYSEKQQTYRVWPGHRLRPCQEATREPRDAHSIRQSSQKQWKSDDWEPPKTFHKRERKVLVRGGEGFESTGGLTHAAK
jgi:hypothetical protein